MTEIQAAPWPASPRCARSLRAAWDCLDRATKEAILTALSLPDVRNWLSDWEFWARTDQLAPEGAWSTWLMIGGRGAGKTRAGAEWVAALARRGAASRIALVGETLADVRDVMIEGVSGLLAVHGDTARPQWKPSLRRLTWSNGTIAQVFSAEDPESLRGPQFAAAWCDEIGKWRHARETWDMLQFGLRLGDAPRVVATTTPRPTALIRALLAAGDTAVTRARTRDNAFNLAPAFLAAVTRAYGGTRVGRQELDGELISERADALWTRDMIEAARERHAPPMARICVAIDPPASSGRHADACGLVVAGITGEGVVHVLEDATLARVRPAEWAARAAALYQRWQADAVVVEVNQGGEMASAVLREVDASLPVVAVRATRGKYLRAEPVAALYAQARVRHVGAFPGLEDEMCDFGPGGLSSGRSPDRLDALVWAVTHLALGPKGQPRVRGL
jgi:phage terminase large subunit-like protein